ncbi:MAG: SLBB domain-containing protein [Desulfobacterales bacterium]|nr:SLBB domain-containing protein [Desulfobacterales bacterium]
MNKKIFISNFIILILMFISFNYSGVMAQSLTSQISNEKKIQFEIEDSDKDKKDLYENIQEGYSAKDKETYKEKIKDVKIEGKAPEKENLSNVEKILSGEFPESISKELTQYGYDFFSKDKSDFQTLTYIPVGDDYIVGPGDQFVIYLWGKAEKNYDVEVNRDGSIILPRVGSINVNGLTYKELTGILSNKLRDYYPDTKMSLTMGKLRSIQIFIIGEASKPGTYTVSSLSTVVSALYDAGGVKKNGSLRNIQLVRNGATISNIDLYNFFIKGIKKNDIFLQSGDTIFIPLIGSVVGISGNVKRPAIYEVKKDEKLDDIIKISGGILPTGYAQSIAVERIKDNKRRVVRTFNVDPFETKLYSLNTPLEDFDLIKIYPISGIIRSVVYLQGHVKYPMEYEYRPGMKISDIISSFDSLLPNPHLNRADILRKVPPTMHEEIIEFNLGALLSGDQTQNLALKELDTVTVYSLEDKEEVPIVTINGSVREPGTYKLYKNMQISDLIFQAGGLLKMAYLQHGRLTRMVFENNAAKTEELTFSTQNAIENIPSDNLQLKPNDVVVIPEIPRYRQILTQKIELVGEFMFPGTYTFSEGEKLDSVIKRAGGLTKFAFTKGASFERESVKKMQQYRLAVYASKLEEEIYTLNAQASAGSAEQEDIALLKSSLEAKKKLLDKMKTAQPTGRMVIQLEDIIEKPSSSYNFVLEPGDKLEISQAPSFVTIIGEVYNPSSLFAEELKSVGYYLNNVGGVTEDADKGQVYLVKANGTVSSKQQDSFWGLFRWDPIKQKKTFGGFTSLLVEPGDTIIVPKKMETYQGMKIAKDTSQILYQLAITTKVISSAL